MQHRQLKWVLGLVAVAGLTALVWWRRPSRLVPPPAVTKATPVVPNDDRSAVSTRGGVDKAMEGMLAAADVASRQAALADLKLHLSRLPPGEAADLILALLRSGKDAPTGLGFRLAAGGVLAEVPTLRTWLLDRLAGLDSAAACTVAREILDTSDSPDEWAIALRNLARGDASAATRDFLETKMRALLRNPAWQANPSIGYLEAFDTAVHLGGTVLVPDLGDLVRRKDNPAVAHAAFLALDRLTLQQPLQMLAELAGHPEWLQGREETRANFFARADLGDPLQRELVENYLLDATRSAAELQAFAGVFPNANFMLSHNLLTSHAAVDGALLARRDQAALAVVNAWLADPRFAPRRHQLERMKVRLEQFAKAPGG